MTRNHVHEEPLQKLWRATENFLFSVNVNLSKSESQKPGRQDGVPPPTLPRPSFQPIVRLIVDDQRNEDGDLADKGTAIVGSNILKPQAAWDLATDRHGKSPAIEIFSLGNWEWSRFQKMMWVGLTTSRRERCSSIWYCEGRPLSAPFLFRTSGNGNDSATSL